MKPIVLWLGIGALYVAIVGGFLYLGVRLALALVHFLERA